MNTANYRLALVAAAGLCTQVWANDGHRVRDEWTPVQWIIVSTTPPPQKPSDPPQGQLNPMGVAVIMEATNPRNNIRVLVSDNDQASQDRIRADLQSRGVDTSKVTFINNPAPSDWARDHSPIVRYAADNSTSMMSFTVNDDAASRTRGENDAVALNQRFDGLLTYDHPGTGSESLWVDGGDFMTTNDGRTLITTTTGLYQEGAYSTDPDYREAVRQGLRDSLGITRVIALQPLDARAPGYSTADEPMRNVHVDMVVRTVPNSPDGTTNQVIVAGVASDDPHRGTVDTAADELTSAGYQVTRLENAQVTDTNGRKYFASYTNAIFLNNTVLVPQYGDVEKDAAALATYERMINDSLSENDPKRKTIKGVNSRESIKKFGAARCAAQQVSVLPCKPASTEASSRNNAQVSFNAETGILSVTAGLINFLGDAGGNITDPQYANDPMMNAVLELSDMTLDPQLSTQGMFAFVGGRVRIFASNAEILSAAVPIFTVTDSPPPGTLGTMGVISEVQLPGLGISSWLDTFKDEVLDDSSRLADFYIAPSGLGLATATQGFTLSVSNMGVGAVGLCGNDPTVPMPGCAWGLAVAGTLFSVRRRR